MRFKTNTAGIFSTNNNLIPRLNIWWECRYNILLTLAIFAGNKANRFHSSRRNLFDMRIYSVFLGIWYSDAI